MANSGRKSKTIAPLAVPGWACPAHLQHEARIAWDHVVGLLASRGSLDRTDPVVIECYATTVAMLRAAQAKVAELGVVVENRFGCPGPNPACSVVNSSAMRIRALANDLGLTPGSSNGATPAPVPAAGGQWGDLLVVG